MLLTNLRDNTAHHPIFDPYSVATQQLSNADELVLRL